MPGKKSDKKETWDLEPPDRPLNPWEPGGDAYARYLAEKAFRKPEKKQDISINAQISKLEERLGHTL